MATLHIQHEEQFNEVTLRVEGKLDAAAALMLGQALDEVTATKLAVDFSRVSDFQDVAIAVLTPALLRRKVRVLGVDTHHERVFKYFGVFHPAADPAYYKAEDLLAI